MNLVTTVRLDPADPRELLAHIRNFNRACNALSELAFKTEIFGWLALQRAAYHWLRVEFGLRGAEAVVAVRKVAYAYSYPKRREHPAHFARYGAVFSARLYGSRSPKNRKLVERLLAAAEQL